MSDTMDPDPPTSSEPGRLGLEHREAVAAWGRRLAASAPEADDLLGSTYAAASMAAFPLQGPRAVRAWLFAIARDLHLGRQGAGSGRPAPARPAPSATPPGRIERTEPSEVEAALERLPADEREALLLSQVFGFDYAEVATILGVGISTVRSRLALGRTRLLRAFASADVPAGGRAPEGWQAVWPWLSALVDDELGVRDRASVEAYVAGHGWCGAALASLRALGRAVSRLDARAAPDDRGRRLVVDEV